MCVNKDYLVISVCIFSCFNDCADSISISLSNDHALTLPNLVLHPSHGHLIIFDFQSEINVLFG